MKPWLTTFVLLLAASARGEDMQKYLNDTQTLVQAGGHLAHYGLDGLEFGGPAGDQIPLLEGMLPLVETPFLIRSMAMPSGRIADIGRLIPREAYKRLDPTQSETSVATRLIAALDDEDVTTLREDSLVRELIAFVTEVGSPVASASAAS